jgi:pimeloyl-ACP methyl ester carboxylesterase
MASFRHDGRRLAYTVYGEGERTTVLIHGLLLSQKMHVPLAKALAARGNRVVTLDLLGHGKSDRPQDMTQYSMSLYGEQVVALLDHLGVADAVLGGTSLGANVVLEAGAYAPDRVRGLIVEMPVLDNALLGCAVAFTPLMLALTIGAPAMRLIARAANVVPAGFAPWLADVGLDTIRQAPEPSAAVLQGLFFGRVAPPKSEREKIRTRTLVIGHDRDPVHPFGDSDALVAELPNARLLRAESILELRTRPLRLTGEIGDFIDECWRARRRRSAPRARRVA